MAGFRRNQGPTSPEYAAGFNDFLARAKDKAEAYVIRNAAEKIRTALGQKGFD